MTAAPLASVKACVFDAYGTLFDVNAAARHLKADLGADMEPLAQVWRTKQLEYTWLRSLMGAYTDFRQITADALDFALDSIGRQDASLRERLLSLYDRLDCYPEVPDVLRRLKALGKQTAILSNGSPGMLTSAVENAGLKTSLDDVLSVDGLQIYKPHPSVYALATERFACRPSDIAFFSSNAWDVAGAAQFGFRVVWINRFAQRPERLPTGPEAEVPALGDALPLFGA